MKINLHIYDARFFLIFLIIKIIYFDIFYRPKSYAYGNKIKGDAGFELAKFYKNS